MIHAVSLMEETALQQALGQLIEAEVIYRRDRPPRASYVFKHALIRDAAYQSLLKSRRHVYHDRIARVLEERFPETRETQPELLAHHYTEAGVTEQAIVYWQRAGQRAIERSASIEAIAYLTQGLELLRALPGDHAQEAEGAFQEALLAARRQQARSWELRAAMSLSRLWQRQGKAKEGRDLLMETYRWFTEGFQTADLREARALLADFEH
jgi:predicted ATPase